MKNITYEYTDVVSVFTQEVDDHQDCGIPGNAVKAVFPIRDFYISVPSEDYVKANAKALGCKIEESKKSHGHWAVYEVVGIRKTSDELEKMAILEGMKQYGLDYRDNTVCGWVIDKVQSYYYEDEES